ncbi:MAG: sensor histidine kinase [Kiloniellaceae bacterium]
MARVEQVPAPAASRQTSLPVGHIIRSLWTKLALLLLVFIAVPIILYGEFRQADWEKRALLLESVGAQGRLIAQSLAPLLEREEAASLPELNERIKRFATPQTGIKVLYRPTGEAGRDGFFFVASEPPVAAETLAAERDRLMARGVLDKLSQSCRGELAIALRHRGAGGKEELLTSITPVNTDSGCWAVITTHTTGEMLGRAIDKPYWNTFEVRMAAAIYVGMAIFTIGLFLAIWRGLLRFREQARRISAGRATGPGFAAQNEVPELAFVAEEFDRMTGALQESAEGIRLAAEDNAHAFKTPIAILRQSLEPVKRIVPPAHARGRRALEVIEESVDRLDHLVASARRLDRTTAELLDSPRREIDLSRLLERLLEAYADSFAGRGLSLDAKLEPGIVVRAGEDMIETAVENVIDNAIEASPAGGAIMVELERREDWAELTVSDRGPGVPAGELEHIFERYVSLRPPRPAAEAAPTEDESERADMPEPHLGIGLWIVRRNLRAIGGDIRAENRSAGGLSVIMRLPLA